MNTRQVAVALAGVVLGAGMRLEAQSAAQGRPIGNSAPKGGTSSTISDLLPDLTPVDGQGKAITNTQTYCERDATGALVVRVKNIGAMPAATSEVLLTYRLASGTLVSEPRTIKSLASGAVSTFYVTLKVGAFSPDLTFTIAADARGNVLERSEKNNKVQGRCLG